MITLELYRLICRQPAHEKGERVTENEGETEEPQEELDIKNNNDVEKGGGGGDSPLNS